MKDSYYVDNAEFYRHMKKWKAAYNKAKRTKQEPPRITPYIGKCLLNIATRIMNSACFNGYSYKEEMTGDALENCVKYIYNFNPKKSKNPFAYFSQICYFSAIRRIKIEKKETKLRSELIDNMSAYDILAEMEAADILGDDRQAIENIVKFLQENSDAIKKENARPENQTKIKRGRVRKKV